MKIGVIPDIHLGAGLNFGKPNIIPELNTRNIDKIKLLNWIIEQIQIYKLDRLVLTGDIFEHVIPDYYLFDILLDFLSKVKIPCHIIYGNHDIRRVGDKYYSVLDLLKYFNSNIYLHSRISSFQEQNVNLIFAPFRDKRSFAVDSNEKALKLLEAELTKEIKPNYKNILIGHLTLEGSLYVGEIDDAHNELICPLSMFEKFDSVYMGHIHTPQRMFPSIEHVGSLEPSTFGESDHNKIILIHDTDTNKIERPEVPHRYLYKLEFVVPPTIDPTSFVKDKLDVINKDTPLKDSLVKIEVTLNEKELNREEIEQKIYDLGVFHIANFAENKTISIMSDEKKNLMNNVVDPKEAIKIYSENSTRFKDLQFKKDFIEKSNSIIEGYNASN